MSKSSRFQLGKVGRLALSGVAGALALLIGGATAQAVVITNPFVVGRGNFFKVGIAEQGSDPFEEVSRFQMVDPAGNAVVFAPGQEGDLVMIEDGFTTATCQGWDTLTGAGGMPSNGCVSDVLRFVNVNGRAEIWFVSDFTDPADFAQLPNFAGAHLAAVSFQEQPALPGLDYNPANRTVATATLLTTPTNPISKVGVRISSDATSQSLSDSISVSVPTMSPALAVGMGVLLLGLGGILLARRRRAVGMSLFS